MSNKYQIAINTPHAPDTISFTHDANRYTIARDRQLDVDVLQFFNDGTNNTLTAEYHIPLGSVFGVRIVTP